MIDLTKALVVMELAATKAGRMLLEMQPRAKRLPARKDFLADADLKSDRIILDALAETYPDISAYTEENGGERAALGYQWIIDPVDGTFNFFLQDGHWGVSIALVHDGQTVAGVVLLPGERKLFSASIEHETECVYLDENLDPRSDRESVRIRVGRQENPADTQFWMAWSKKGNSAADHEKEYDILKRLFRASLYPQIRNSATADLMVAAEGKIAGYVFPKPEPFDIAAAALIIERAGGKVTDTQGNPWSPFSEGIVASNGVIHDKLLGIINQ